MQKKIATLEMLPGLWSPPAAALEHIMDDGFLPRFT
jgi:hypothetical protein